jgi:signal transduction histidine kinase
VQQSNVLVLTDDPAFAHAVAARWRSDHRSPARAITQVSSDVGEAAMFEDYRFAILGPVRDGALEPLLRGLESAGVEACVCGETNDKDSLFQMHPRVLRIQLQDDWLEALMLVSKEVLRRLDADARARQAEHAAAMRGTEATLGRYMLEMSHIVSDTLTSLVGNADLLLLAAEPVSKQGCEQIRTIRAMGLRLSQIMERFSSLANEIGAVEKQSQGETAEAISARIPGL